MIPLRQLVQHWISDHLPPDHDARRARLINMLLGSFVLGLGIYTLIGLIGWIGRWIAAGPIIVLIGLSGISLASLIYTLNRRGQLEWAAWSFAGALCLVVLILLLLYGHRGGVTMIIPVIVLASAILLRRQAAIWSAALLSGIYILIAWLEISGRWQPWLMPYSTPFPADLLISGHLLGIWLMALLAWLSVGSLLDALESTQERLAQTQQQKQELEQAQAQLQDRTQNLGQELSLTQTRLERQEQEQQTLLNTLRRQAIPVIPIVDQLVTVPVIGIIDAARAELLLTSLLEGIQRYDARFVLLDITGAPLIDQQAAQGLAQAVLGARIVGAECILVGVNPQVAARLVELNLNLSDFVSRVDMQAGIRYALGQLNYYLIHKTS